MPPEPLVPYSQAISGKFAFFKQICRWDTDFQSMPEAYTLGFHYPGDVVAALPTAETVPEIRCRVMWRLAVFSWWNGQSPARSFP